MAGVVAITGTVTTITTTPTDEGGSVHFDDIANSEGVARTGVSDDSEGYQEVNLFIGELVQQYAFPSGNAAIDWLMQKLQAMRQQPIDGSDRVYEQ